MIGCSFRIRGCIALVIALLFTSSLPAWASPSDFDCLLWRPGAAEDSVTKPDWIKTQASPRITTYHTSRQSVDGATVQRQIIFVDGKLAMSIVKAYPSQQNVEAIMSAMFDKIFQAYGSAEKTYNGNIRWTPSDGWSQINGLQKDGAIVTSAAASGLVGIVYEGIGRGLVNLIY